MKALSILLAKALPPILLLCLFTLLACPAVTGAAESAQGPVRGNIMLILDGSGSMWARVDGKTKIEIAQQTLAELVDNLPEDVNAGLVAYGHRTEGDCADVEVMVPLGPADKAALKKAVDSVKPKGKTPITEAVRQTAAGLRGIEGETTILLVSDGKETCAGDPCALVRELRASGVKFVMDVIGFDVTDAERAQLECMAEAGGGKYYSAKDAAQFKQAVAETAKKKSLAGSVLHVTVLRNGQEIRAHVEVMDKESGALLHHDWTYLEQGFVKNLAPGEYILKVTDDKAADQPSQTQEITLEPGQTLDQEVTFGSGVVRVATTLDGTPFEAFIEVYKAGGGERVLSTFSDNNAHVAELVLPGGAYDITVEHRKCKDEPKRVFKDVTVEAGSEQAMDVAFESGTLEVSLVLDGAEVAGEVHILNNETKSMFWFEKCAPGQPAVFKLSPGLYTLRLDSVGRDGSFTAQDVADVAVQAGQTTKQAITIVRE